MARILLGVSGGIAAYKAVELVRLATGAGHSVRVIQTPASLNFVGRATFEGVTGAPVLVDEFEPDPARGAFPGDAASDHSPISHLELVARRTCSCVAPASANTIAKLAGGLADNLLTAAALANTRAARGRARDEQPHVRAPGDAGEPRAAALARRSRRGPRQRPRWHPGASGAWAGWRSPRRSWRPSRRCSRPSTRPAHWTAFGCS